MRLLEIVTGPETSPETAEAVVRFGDVTLGKSIVRCNDRPGFIANRLGIYWMQLGMLEAIDQGLTVEEADAIVGPPMGIPKTGIFGLMDLVGIDLGPQINASMRSALPAGDAFHGVDREVPLVTRMISQGLTGRKGKGGFYRLEKTEAGRTKVAIDLNTGEYRPEQAGASAGGRRTRPEGAAVGRRARLGTYAFRCWRRRSPMPRPWCRKRRGRSPISMRRCGSATRGNGVRSNWPTSSARPGWPIG